MWSKVQVERVSPTCLFSSQTYHNSIECLPVNLRFVVWLLFVDLQSLVSVGQTVHGEIKVMRVDVAAALPRRHDLRLVAISTCGLRLSIVGI